MDKTKMFGYSPMPSAQELVDRMFRVDKKKKKKEEEIFKPEKDKKKKTKKNKKK